MSAIQTETVQRKENTPCHIMSAVHCTLLYLTFFFTAVHFILLQFTVFYFSSLCFTVFQVREVSSSGGKKQMILNYHMATLGQVCTATANKLDKKVNKKQSTQT